MALEKSNEPAAAKRVTPYVEKQLGEYFIILYFMFNILNHILAGIILATNAKEFNTMEEFILKIKFRLQPQVLLR